MIAMKSAFAAVVVCALVLTSTPCLAQRSVGGATTAIAEGMGGFAKGGNFHCMGRGCDGLDVDDERYSFTEAAVTGRKPRPRGAGKSQAATKVVVSKGPTGSFTTGSLSSAEGKGHLSNMASAHIAVDESKLNDTPYLATSSSMLLRGHGLAKGSAGYNAGNSGIGVAGGVKGSARGGRPHHYYHHQPAVLAQYVENSDTGLLSDSYINGYKSQAFGSGGEIPTPLSKIRTNAQGSGLASSSASFQKIPNPTPPSIHLFSKPGNQAFALAEVADAEKRCEKDGVETDPMECNQDTPSWLHTNPFDPIITSASESGLM